jgi:predicted ArsR family transcriptional regulator
MTPRRLSLIHATRLAARPSGVTAGELAGAAALSLRGAQKLLADLAADGILEADRPERKGKRRGDWRTTYRIGGGGRG